MMRLINPIQWMAAGLLGVVLGAGCGSQSATPGDESGPTREAQANLAALSPQDRAVAARQKTCPVSGEVLGAMGTPYKTSVDGRDVFLCCDGCSEKIHQEPDKYLKNLPPATTRPDRSPPPTTSRAPGRG